MDEKRKEKNPQALKFSMVFLIVFTMVFSVGVVVGKKFIPSDEQALKEESPSLPEKPFSFGPTEKLSEEKATEPDSSQNEIPLNETSSNETPPKKESASDQYLSTMINQEYKYTIQVSSFLSKKVANRTVRFYKDKGYPAFIREYSPSEITTFYRVRIGTFQSKEEAREYGDEIQAKERDFKFYVTLND